MDPQPQNVLDYHGNNTIFNVWNFRNDANVKDAFKKLCALIINLNHSADVRFEDLSVSCVMGIGYHAWAQLQLPVPIPKELESFAPIVGGKYTAISTRGDLHFHIRAFNNRSICYDMAAAISEVLSPVAESVEEIHGFRYWDGRSILGLVDGTENPHRKERAFFGLVGDEDPVYKGGSYLFVQKYVHDLMRGRNYPWKSRRKSLEDTKQATLKCPIM